MTWATTAPAAIQALWQATVNEAALNPDPGLDIRNGTTLNNGSALRVISIGYMGPDDDAVTEGTMASGDVGGSSDEETYQIHCTAAGLVGTSDPVADRNVVFALMGIVGAAISRDRKLGGTVAGARIITWALREDQTTGGLEARLRFDVEVRAFTTR